MLAVQRFLCLAFMVYRFVFVLTRLAGTRWCMMLGGGASYSQMRCNLILVVAYLSLIVSISQKKMSQNTIIPDAERTPTHVRIVHTMFPRIVGGGAHLHIGLIPGVVGGWPPLWLECMSRCE